MIDMRRASLNQLGSIAHQRPQGTDFGIGPKGGLKQAERVKLLEPLGIIPIGLASWYGLDVPGVDQVGCDAGLFKQLVDRDSKHAG